MSNLAYLSFGSNINPEANVRAALNMLADHGDVVVVSTVWETTPVGFKDQANFLNGALIFKTDLSAPALKTDVLSQIERQLGRKRTANKNAPRTMDLDIIFFNNLVIEVDGRKIPSPEILERAFVALPLAEIAPDYRHPVTGQTLTEIAQTFTPNIAAMIRRDDVLP